MIGYMKRLKRMAECVPFHVWYATVALFSLVFMICYGANTSFWFDEFAQICYSGLGKSLTESALVLDPTPPLFNIAANIWYNLVPYGDRWLLLLPQLATAASVYVVSLWAEKAKGKEAGLCAAVLLGTSQMVLEQCGFEFRGYGFYLLFSSLAMYQFHCRLTPGGKKTLAGEAAFTLTLTALLYCHMFASMIFAVLGVVELVLVLRKKCRPVVLAPYLFAGVAFLPWLIRFLLIDGADIAAPTVDWMVKPTPWEVIKLAAYLCGNHIIVCILFVLGILSVLLVARRTPADAASRQMLVPLAVGVFQVGVMYLYGKIRTGYASLWVKRYFAGLFPCCSVFCAIGLVSAAEYISCRYKKMQTLWICAAVLGMIAPVFLIKTAVGDTPLGVYHHREAAEFLMEQEDVWEEDTIVLSTLGGFTEGWYDYYVERLNQRKGFRAESIYDIDEDQLSTYKTVYVDVGFTGGSGQAFMELEHGFVLDKVWDSLDLRRYLRVQ